MATLCSKSGPSSSSTTDLRTVGMSMCWGHFSTHCPHWTHRDANSGSPRATASTQPCSIHELFLVGIVDQVQVVILLETEWNIHTLPDRAYSTGSLYSLLSSVHDTCSPLFLSAAVPLLSENLGMLCLQLLRFSSICVFLIHPGEDNRDLWMVPYPAKCPFCRGPLCRGFIPDLFHSLRHGFCQVPSTEGLHNDYSKAF